VIDFDDVAAQAPLLDRAFTAFGGLDVVLIAYGSLPDQAVCEASTEATLKAFHSNATSVIALMSELARRLQTPSTLAVISSVAGDRGRASNGVYGCAKAAVSAAASALRQSHGKRGVQVLTIKPGLVDSPMTAHLDKSLIWTRPERVARGIVNAIERRRDVVYLPAFWRLIMLAIRAMPEFIFKRLSF
jgi:short-subunit dehydrogenase